MIWKINKSLLFIYQCSRCPVQAPRAETRSSSDYKSALQVSDSDSGATGIFGAERRWVVIGDWLVKGRVHACTLCGGRGRRIVGAFYGEVLVWGMRYGFTGWFASIK
jgi:hypothetical protein